MSFIVLLENYFGLFFQKSLYEIGYSIFYVTDPPRTISRFQCMPELELETVFEHGTSPVISPDPSNSIENERSIPDF